MDVGASILQKIPVSRFVSISEGKVSWGLDPHFSMVASSSGLGRCALRTENRSSNLLATTKTLIL